MVQDYVSPLPLTLIAAVHTACLFASVGVLRATQAYFPGWRVVSPGRTHWFCFLACWAFALLITWVWVFVGSARHDAQVQMQYALLLIFAFGFASAWTGFYIAQLRRAALRWQGTTIHWRKRGSDVIQDMRDLDAFRRTLSGALRLRFRDGTFLRLALYARNAEDLARVILMAGFTLDVHGGGPNHERLVVEILYLEKYVATITREIVGGPCAIEWDQEIKSEFRCLECPLEGFLIAIEAAKARLTEDDET